MSPRYTLLLYPFSEVVFLGLGIYWIEKNLVLALVCLVLAALALNFSLHISIHYFVHFKTKVPGLDWFLELLSSLLIGLSFQYYQMSHWNHHRYDNTLGDFTSTWKEGAQGPEPRNIGLYALLWPLNSLRLPQQKAQAMREGYFNRDKNRRMRLEMLVLLAFIGGLFWLNPLWGLGYCLMVYLGWVFISWQNYGQHVPKQYGQPTAYSYYHRLYNKLFLNNGWHLEHHMQPQRRYWDLKPLKTEAAITQPHLVEGFYTAKEKATEGLQYPQRETGQV
jgi:fatty acid desaturase